MAPMSGSPTFRSVPTGPLPEVPDPRSVIVPWSYFIHTRSAVGRSTKDVRS